MNQSQTKNTYKFWKNIVFAPNLNEQIPCNTELVWFWLKTNVNCRNISVHAKS